MDDRLLAVSSPQVRRALLTHRAERDAWLAATRAALHHDEQVDAAWLFGSLGRGDGDVLSDIDLFVSVADERFPASAEQRSALVADVASPLLILEAPQNWPPSGVYAMALYPGTYGPHQVDWYWVRRSAAQIPTQTQILFDRGGLPRLDQPTRFAYAPVPERSPEEVATQIVNLFWVMLMITAKYTARAPWRPQHDLLASTALHLHNVATFVEMALPGAVAEPPLASPEDTVQRLRVLAAAMEQLMPLVQANGGTVPVLIVPAAERYLRLAEALSVDMMRHHQQAGRTVDPGKAET